MIEFNGQQGLMTIICDFEACGVCEEIYGDSWTDCFNQACDMGWHAYRHEGEWHHNCPDHA